MASDSLIFLKIHMKQGSKILYATLNSTKEIEELTPDVLHFPSLVGTELVINREAISHIEISPNVPKEAING